MSETVKVVAPPEELKTQTYPANVVQLPSKGLLYDPESPLASGKVDIKFMTAKEENILTTESYIKDGTVIDRLLQSLVITKFNFDDLLIGDKDALIIASRIYGYGENYDIKVKAPSGKDQETTINLSELPNKEFDESLYANGNRFEFITPLGKNKIVFKLLTVGDQKQIDAKLKKYRKAGSPDTQITTRLGQMIISVDGNEDPFYIKLFVENDLRAPDSRALREYVAKVQCGVNMEIELVDEETSEPFRTNIAIGADFFWPDSRV